MVRKRGTGRAENRDSHSTGTDPVFPAAAAGAMAG